MKSNIILSMAVLSTLSSVAVGQSEQPYVIKTSAKLVEVPALIRNGGQRVQNLDATRCALKDNGVEQVIKSVKGDGQGSATLVLFDKRHIGYGMPGSDQDPVSQEIALKFLRQLPPDNLIAFGNAVHGDKISNWFSFTNFSATEYRHQLLSTAQVENLMAQTGSSFREFKGSIQSYCQQLDQEMQQENASLVQDISGRSAQARALVQNVQNMLNEDDSNKIWRTKNSLIPILSKAIHTLSIRPESRRNLVLIIPETYRTLFESNADHSGDQDSRKRQIQALIDDATKAHVKVVVLSEGHVINSTDKPELDMSALANGTGGFFLSLPNLELAGASVRQVGLNHMVNKTIDLIGADYHFYFSPNPSIGDGTLHTLDLTCTGADVYARPTYFSPKDNLAP